METNPIRVCELLVGLGDVNVLGVVDVADSPIRIHVETRPGATRLRAMRNTGGGQGPAGGRVGGSPRLRSAGTAGVA